MKNIFMITLLLLSLNPFDAEARGIDSGGADGLARAEIIFDYLMTSGFSIKTIGQNEVIQVSEVRCYRQKGRWGSMACYAIDEQRPQQSPKENLKEVLSTNFPSVLLKIFGTKITETEDQYYFSIYTPELTCLQNIKNGKTTCLLAH